MGKAYVVCPNGMDHICLRQDRSRAEGEEGEDSAGLSCMDLKSESAS